MQSLSLPISLVEANVYDAMNIFPGYRTCPRTGYVVLDNTLRERGRRILLCQGIATANL